MRDSEDREYYDDEVDLGEIISALSRRKWLILGIVGFSLVLAIGWDILKSRYLTEALIQLNFSGMEKHKYPDGSQFDMYDIIAPDVINRAATAITDTKHRESFTSNPRGFIFIDPFIPFEIKAKMKKMEKEHKTYIYLPNQFYLRFIQPRSGIFTPEERKQVLLAIINVYRDDFMDRFVNQPLLDVNFLKGFVSSHDYEDVYRTMDNCVKTYVGFLDARIKDAGHYRSPTTNESFVDIKASLEAVENTDLKEVGSIIGIFHLTRNRANLIKQYQYRLKEIRKDKEKKEKEATVARQLLQEVWQKSRGNMSIASGTRPGDNVPGIMLNSDILEKLSDRDNVALLLKKALDAEIEAKSLGVDETYLEKDLAAVMADKPEGKDKGTYDWVEKRLNTIQARLQELAKDANELNQEYLRNKFSSVVQILEYPRSSVTYPRNPCLVIALSLVLSLMFAIFIALFLEYLAGRKKES